MIYLNSDRTEFIDSDAFIGRKWTEVLSVTDNGGIK